MRSLGAGANEKWRSFLDAFPAGESRPHSDAHVAARALRRAVLVTVDHSACTVPLTDRSQLQLKEAGAEERPIHTILTGFSVKLASSAQNWHGEASAGM